MAEDGRGGERRGEEGGGGECEAGDLFIPSASTLYTALLLPQAGAGKYGAALGCSWPRWRLLKTSVATMMMIRTMIALHLFGAAGTGAWHWCTCRPLPIFFSLNPAAPPPFLGYFF